MGTHPPSQNADSVADNIDLETQQPVGQDISDENVKATEGKKENEPNIVDWDGEDDPENSRNWSVKQKWTNGGLLAAMTLVT